MIVKNIIRNAELKKIMKQERISYWMVAEVMGVSESTVGRVMRVEMDDERKNVFLEAIKTIEEMRNAENG